MRAAWNNRPQVIASLLAAGALAHGVHAVNGAAVLHWAADCGHVEPLRVLLDHPGIDIEQPNGSGCTALMRAARNNRADAVACLIAAGASMEAVNPEGASALSLAFSQGRAAAFEVFLLHGAKPGGAAPDFFPAAPQAELAAIADLCAEQDLTVADFPAPDQALAFFNELILNLQDDGATHPMRRWLRARGMRMACAEQVAAAVAGARAAWRPQSAGANCATLQQQMNYCFGALASLGPQGGARVLERYRAAGISAAACERLAVAAAAQLEYLVSLALDAAAQVGAGMLDPLVDACLATTGLGCTVDAPALKERLVRDGYCALVAQAIALSWRDALASLSRKCIVVPDGLTMGQAAQFLREQSAAQAPALLALAMQPHLDARERLSTLQAMLGAGNDEGLHGLFQLQCDQLRQFCAQLLAQEDPPPGQAPGAVTGVRQ